MAQQVKDPVCGLEFDASNAAAMDEYDGRNVYFCSDYCRDAFVRDVEQYETS